MAALTQRLEPLHVFQTPWELQTVVALCAALEPKRILEVGSWMGGTLEHWLRIADHVTVVDDEMRNLGAWRDWAREENAALAEIKGHSRAPEVIAKAAGAGPYDWVFIDADHSYAGVSADWENYGAMVAPGGAVAFHDIYDRPADHEYGVHQLWTEIKSEPGARWVEIQQMPTEHTTSDHNGIGVVWPS